MRTRVALATLLLTACPMEPDGGSTTDFTTGEATTSASSESTGTSEPVPCSKNEDCPPCPPNVCPVGQFCKKAEGDCDGMGVCTIAPSSCPNGTPSVYCGCDGAEYAQACDLDLYQVSLDCYNACPCMRGDATGGATTG